MVRPEDSKPVQNHRLGASSNEVAGELENLVCAVVAVVLVPPFFPAPKLTC